MKVSRANWAFCVAIVLSVGVVNVANATDVSVELSGVQGPSMAGVYTDPYQLKISAPGTVLTQPDQFANVQTTANAFCDDFQTETYLDEIWQSHVTNMAQLANIAAPLSSLKFDTGSSAGKQQQDYMAMAWLAEQIVATNQNTSAGRTQAGELSFALWNVFDSGRNGALAGLSSQQRQAATADYNLAYASIAKDNPSNFLNVNIYTPDPLSSSQEFLVVNDGSQSSSSGGSPSPSVPAPKVGALFALAVVLFTIGSLRRKRQQRAKG